MDVSQDFTDSPRIFVILDISHFSFEHRELVMIVEVPGDCFLFYFIVKVL